MFLIIYQILYLFALKLSVKMSGGVTDDVIFSVNILVKHAELNFSVYVQRKLEKVE